MSSTPVAYRTDLAYIHDAGFGQLAAHAAPVLLEILHRRKLDRGLVIDVGCGSGILAEQLAAAGYKVLGFDLSAAMIALARKRVPTGKFRQQSFVAAEFPPCVAVSAIGEIFNYLFDGDNTGESLARMLRRIYEALCPRGVFLFDVAGPGRVHGGSLRQFREEEHWAVLVSTQEDRQKRLLTREITSFRKVGKLYRRDHEVHRLRLLARSELAARLRGIGFQVRMLRNYGPLRFPPGWISFLAVKPG